MRRSWSRPRSPEDRPGAAHIGLPEGSTRERWRAALLRGLAHVMLAHDVIVVYEDGVTLSPEAEAAKAGAAAFIEAFTRADDASQGEAPAPDRVRPRRKRWRLATKEEREARDAEIVHFRLSGMTRAAVAARLDCSTSLVYQVERRGRDTGPA